ncbi:MAG TPA: hypothetical protein PK349_05035 [Candidatus Hydrogenedentes bacterium]|nr:hypothetical protein [Candidatus Hydrogenedentota bacterium]
METSRPKFVFVIGHESSGNRLAGETVARATGFDYDDGENHLDDRGHIYATYLHHVVQQWWDDPSRIVCDHSRVTRRSLPHGGLDESLLKQFTSHPLTGRHFPDPIPFAKALEEAGYEVYFVLTVRDQWVAKLSKIREHVFAEWTNAEREMEAARLIMERILGEFQRVFVFSYESLMYLGPSYVQSLYRFLGVESDYVPPLRDANPKYVMPVRKTLFNILRRARGLKLGVCFRRDTAVNWGGDVRALETLAKGLQVNGVNVIRASGPELLPEDVHLAFISNTCDDRRPDMEILRQRRKPYVLIGFHEDFSLYYPTCIGFGEYVSLMLQKRDLNNYVPNLDDLWHNPNIVLNVAPPVPRNVLYNLEVMREALFCQAASDTEAATMRRDCPDARVEAVYWDIPLLRDTEGGNEDFLKLTGLTSGEYLLQVGRIETRKNQVGTVLATRHIDAPLVFVATRGYQPWYELLVVNAAAKYRRGQTIIVSQEHASQRVSENVRIIQMPGGERLSEACLAGAYRHCGLHIHPAFYEAPGYTYLEAAASGVATVASAWGALQDYCRFQTGDETMGGRFEYVLPHHLAALEKAVLRNFGRRFDSPKEHPIFRRTTEDVGKDTLACLERHADLVWPGKID